MPLQQLTLDSLRKLDGGKAVEAFQRHLARAAIDCEDRPGDKTARKVTLEIGVIPVVEDDLTCTEVRYQILASSTVPKHRTKVYSGRLHKSGIISFNEDSPDNVNQTTLLGEEE